jgi:hypothetical protein
VQTIVKSLSFGAFLLVSSARSTIDHDNTCPPICWFLSPVTSAGVSKHKQADQSCVIEIPAMQGYAQQQ